MAQYTIIQDIEAEDKLVGALTLRQFIYACIAAVCLYLSYVTATHHAAFMLVVLLPIAAMGGFFAFPWRRDQPTEVWALAQVRFLIKPRKRVWDQDGAQELVTITAPKNVDRQRTNGLSQGEVRSRLGSLANTLDSRGWAVKGTAVSTGAPAGVYAVDSSSDRLVAASSLPQQVSDIDVLPSDDILDEDANPVARRFDADIAAARDAKRVALMTQLAAPAPQPAAAPTANSDQWFTAAQVPTTTQPPVAPEIVESAPVPIPQPAVPTAAEEAMVEHFKEERVAQTASTLGHLKTIKTPEQIQAEAAAQRAADTATQQVTAEKQAAILNLSSSDHLHVDTVSRQASKDDDGAVDIRLH